MLLDAIVMGMARRMLASPQRKLAQLKADEFSSPEDYQSYQNFVTAAQKADQGNTKDLYLARQKLDEVIGRNPVLFARFHEQARSVLQTAIDTGAYDIGDAMVAMLSLPTENALASVEAKLHAWEATGIPMHHQLAFYHRLAWSHPRRDEIYEAIRCFAKACHDYVTSTLSKPQATPYQRFLEPDFTFSRVFAPGRADMLVIEALSALTPDLLRQCAYGAAR